MARLNSREGKRAFVVKATSEPHEDYKEWSPHYDERLVPGIAILKEGARGNVLLKEVIRKNMVCKECGGQIRLTNNGTRYCVSCGLVPGNSPERKIVRNENSAGRN